MALNAERLASMAFGMGGRKLREARLGREVRLLAQASRAVPDRRGRRGLLDIRGRIGNIGMDCFGHSRRIVAKGLSEATISRSPGRPWRKASPKASLVKVAKTPGISSQESGKRSQTRDRILAGALAALSQRGLRKVSIEDICIEAGVSRRTLYRNFDSREEIIAGVAEHRREKFEIELARAIEARPSLDNRVEVVLGYLISAGRMNEAYRLASSDLEFLRDSVADSFGEYVEMIRCTVEPIFAAEPALAQAGMSSKGLAELMMRFSMQALLTPSVDHRQAAGVFSTFWRLAVRGAHPGG